MRGGMCPPCLMAGGVASGKLMLGAAAGLTGLSGAAVLKSKKKNSFKRGGSLKRKRKRRKRKNTKQRKKINRISRRKSISKSKKNKNQ